MTAEWIECVECEGIGINGAWIDCYIGAACLVNGEPHQHPVDCERCVGEGGWER